VAGRRAHRRRRRGGRHRALGHRREVLRRTVWKFLGGKVRDEVPVYANGWHIGERTPENYARHAKEAVEEQGYPALKCDPSAHYEHSLSDPQLAEIADLLETVRDAVGWEVGIALDCHGRLSRRGAIQVANALEEYDITFLEEPVELEDREVLADVIQHVNMPGDRRAHLQQRDDGGHRPEAGV